MRAFRASGRSVTPISVYEGAFERLDQLKLVREYVQYHLLSKILMANAC